VAEGWSTKWWFVPALIVGMTAFTILVAKTLTDQGSRARDADRMEKREHDTRCRAARVLFFESCIATGYARWYCEVQWSQLHDQVWDSPPTKPWAEQIDCAEKKE
jgi:hypothetical protein